MCTPENCHYLQEMQRQEDRLKRYEEFQASPDGKKLLNEQLERMIQATASQRLRIRHESPPEALATDLCNRLQKFGCRVKHLILGAQQPSR